MVIKLIKKVIKIKVDLDYKQRIYAVPLNRRSVAIFQFIQDAKDTMKKIYEEIEQQQRKERKEKQKNSLTKQTQTKFLEDEDIGKRLPRKKTNDMARSNSDKELNTNTIVSPDNKFFENDSFKDLRGKSCCCGSCGGHSYYKRIQRIINVFPLLHDKG